MNYPPTFILNITTSVTAPGLNVLNANSSYAATALFATNTRILCAPFATLSISSVAKYQLSTLENAISSSMTLLGSHFQNN